MQALNYPFGATLGECILKTKPYTSEPSTERFQEGSGESFFYETPKQYYRVLYTMKH